MQRICKYCGAEYAGDPGSSACPTCVARLRATSVRPRICVDCGTSFDGGPAALRCPSCRLDRRRETDRSYRRRGAARPLGSTDYCQVCGQSYTVNSGLQKYCPNCAAQAIREKDQAQSRAWNRRNTSPEQRREERQTATAARICAVCGKAFVPDSKSLTCSSSCAEKLKRQNAGAWEADHRLQRNAYHKDRIKAKEQAMTPEQYKTYRETINARARINYAKRKNKKDNA